jgi:hypothetical protein
MKLRNAACAWVLIALFGGACGDRDCIRYVGRGTAEVIPRHRPEDRQTRTSTDEAARARRLDDGRIEVTLDECTLTTEAASSDGKAPIPAGTRCGADRSMSSAHIVVTSGEVTLDEVAGTLALRLEGDGRAQNLGTDVDVRYRYTFEGRSDRGEGK